MKKSTSFFFMLFVASYCFNQTENPNPEKIKKVSTTTSGIVVYESAGVEGFKKEEIQNLSPQKELTEYSLEELELALSQVDGKLLKLERLPADNPQKLQYLATRAKIIKQLAVVNEPKTK